jgi:hypothetical protein
MRKARPRAALAMRLKRRFCRAPIRFCRIDSCQNRTVALPATEAGGQRSDRLGVGRARCETAKERAELGRGLKN